MNDFFLEERIYCFRCQGALKKPMRGLRAICQKCDRETTQQAIEIVQEAEKEAAKTIKTLNEALKIPKSMKKSYSGSILIILCTVAISIILLHKEISDMKTEAVQSGAAYWRVSPDGSKIFVWKTEK